jgi:hypothetical protein
MLKKDIYTSRKIILTFILWLIPILILTSCSDLPSNQPAKTASPPLNVNNQARYSVEQVLDFAQKYSPVCEAKKIVEGESG